MGAKAAAEAAQAAVQGGDTEGLVRGLTLEVLHCRLTVHRSIYDHLPDEQRTGLFASPATYDGIVRLNVTEHGAVRLSIRLDVPHTVGPLLPEAEAKVRRPGVHQVDFLVAEQLKEFFTPDVPVLAELVHLGNGKPTACEALSTLARKFSAIVRALRSHTRSQQALDPTHGVLGKAYFAGLPFKLGDGPNGAVKLGFTPKQFDRMPKELNILHSGYEGGKKLKRGGALTGRERELAKSYGAALRARLEQGLKAAADEPLATWRFVVQPSTGHPTHAGNSAQVPSPV